MLDEPRQGELLLPLMDRWTRRDLEGARRFALEQTGSSRRTLMSSFISSWMRISPGTLEDWLGSPQDPDVLEIGLPMVVQSLSYKNPARAHTFWKKLPRDYQSGLALSVFGAWMRQDPASATTNLMQSPAAEVVPEGLQQQALQAWARADAPAVVTYLQQMPDGKRRRQWIESVASVLGKATPTQAVQLVQSLPNGDNRLELLRAVTRAWATENPRAAFDWARNLPEGAERDLALGSSLDLLGKSDPSTLRAFILQEPANPAVVEGAAVLARHFLGTNTAGLLDWARQLPPGPARERVLSQGFSAMEDLPPKEAIAFTLEHLSGATRQSALKGIFSHWTRRDPKSASAAAIELPLGGNRAEVYGVVASSWSAAEPVEAMNWVLTLDDDLARQLAEGALVRVLQLERPAEAAAFVAKLRPSEHSARLTESIVVHWSKLDVDSAAKWLSQQPDDLRRRYGYGKLAEITLVTDIKRAAEYAIKSPADSDHRAIREKVASSWARTDPESATKWVANNETNDIRLQLNFNSTFAAWARSAPQQALGYLIGLPQDFRAFKNPEVRERCLQTTIGHWATSEPKAAIRWVEANATGKSGSQLIQAVLNRWVNEDPDEMLRWLQGIPEGASRDRFAAPGLRILASSQPRLASDNVGLVADSKERISVMESIFYIWRLRDVEAAKAWLQTSGVPETTKARLLETR